MDNLRDIFFMRCRHKIQTYDQDTSAIIINNLESGVYVNLYISVTQDIVLKVVNNK